MAFISGPAEKLIRALIPNFLLKADSSSANPFRPPKVSEPATKTNSPSFLAPVTNWSRVSALPAEQVHIHKNEMKAEATSCFVAGFLKWFIGKPKVQNSKTLAQRADFLHAGVESDLPIFVSIADDPYRIPTLLHGFNGFFDHIAQHDNALIGCAEVFLIPAIDRPLTFLRDAILIM